MAKSLIKANKYGDWKVCKSSRVSKAKVDSYCNANFLEDYVKNNQCKDMEDFCYICCENEYGNMYIKQRDICYDMCDAMAKRDLSNGEWRWKYDLNKTKKKKKLI